MTLTVAINGFGRIGRLVFRALLESGRKDLNVVVINDLASPEISAHLLKYDSVHGTLPAEVLLREGVLEVMGQTPKMLSERDPTKLPWAEMKVDVVLECSGVFTERDKTALHLAAGAKKVLISAPATNADKTIVYGVNHQTLTPKDLIVSNASCTTNCLAPVAMVLDQAVGIESGFMTTIHSYTGDQALVDTAHKDLRRARAGAISMIPTSTGAAKALGLVLPNLTGKLDGTAIRVPTPDASLVDLTFEASRPTTIKEINDAIGQAAAGPLKGILGVNSAPLVSVDFIHNPHSSIFDLTQTAVIQGRLCRILSWYDNEWGFSNRMLDVAKAMGGC